MFERIRTTEQEKPRFDIDKALNTQGFVEFLSNYPDHASLAMDEGSAEELGRRFEAFETKKKASKEFKEFYKGAIEKEIGIKLEEEELASIDTFLNRASVEDPEYVKAVFEQIPDFHKCNARIAEKEKEMLALAGGKDAEEIKKVIEEIDEFKEEASFGKTLPFIGLFFRTSEENQMLKEAREKYGVTIRNREKKLKRVMEIQEAKGANVNKLNYLKGILFQEFEPVQKIAEFARRKAVDQLGTLSDKRITTGTLEAMEEEQQHFDKLRGDGEFNLDYLADLDKDGFQQELDEAISGKIAQELARSIRDFRTETNTSNIYNAFEHSIEKYTKKEKVGSKEGEEARTFIQDTLRGILSEMGDGEGAKAILLKRLIIKLGA